MLFVSVKLLLPREMKGWPVRPAACAMYCESGGNQVLMGTKEVANNIEGPSKAS